MARSRPALESAINEILRKHGAEGKRMSYRQAERVTGLSPATVGELAKGNARTQETLRRFAVGLGEDPNRLLLLAGFVPEAPLPPTGAEQLPSYVAEQRPSYVNNEIEPDVSAWLDRFGRALATMPPGREQELWKDSLRRNTELLECCLARLNPPASPETESV